MGTVLNHPVSIRRTKPMHGEKIGIRPCVTLLLWSCGGCITHHGERERLNGQFGNSL